MTQPIWHGEPTLAQANSIIPGTLADFWDIQITEIGPDFMVGTMPVGPRVFQPMRLVHGGANVAFAETIASIASNWAVDRSRYYCLGQEINANHLRGVREGIITATTRPAHIGKRSHVWEIHLTDDNQKLTCISRITMAVVEHR